MTKNCPICGYKLEDMANFCPSCGAKSEIPQNTQSPPVTKTPLPPQMNTSNSYTSPNYQYQKQTNYYQKSNNTMMIIALILIILVIASVLIVFFMFNNDGDSSDDSDDNSDDGTGSIVGVWSGSDSSTSYDYTIEFKQNGSVYVTFFTETAYNSDWYTQVQMMKMKI